MKSIFLQCLFDKIKLFIIEFNFGVGFLMITGRIIRGVGGLYFIDTEEGVFKCKARGIFRKKRIIPTVGDYVEITILDKTQRTGFIEKINERKNFLIRPKVANIDNCIITFAAKSPSINFDLLDRFLILSEEKNLDVIICINKYDLIEEDIEQYIKRVYSPVYKVVFTDTINNNGIDKLKILIKDKVSVIAGPSGAGKSSIINRIISSETRKTGEISRKIERGKHTTREVELLSAGEKTFIVDSPGFTSVSVEHLNPVELQFFFREFKDFLKKCKFNDCLHLQEPDCSIRNNIGDKISEERYKRYEFLYNELIQKRK